MASLPLLFGCVLAGGVVIHYGTKELSGTWASASSSGGSASTPATIDPADAPAAAQKALQRAQALVGSPYSQAGHASAFDAAAAEVLKLGTDCSGALSTVLGPLGAGILSSPQTTQTLPDAAGIQSGAGQYITIYDRDTGATNEEHMIFNILGNWFEEGGNSTFNPSGGFSQLTAAQAQGELDGGDFQQYHPQGM